ncbi:MAG: hypothetical protein M1602_03910, partial [Firmicutes bacterium]|nr:hypothetical protein [Bacillota bacterium]
MAIKDPVLLGAAVLAVAVVGTAALAAPGAPARHRAGDIAGGPARAPAASFRGMPGLVDAIPDAAGNLGILTRQDNGYLFMPARDQRSQNGAQDTRLPVNSAWLLSPTGALGWDSAHARLMRAGSAGLEWVAAGNAASPLAAV